MNKVAFILLFCSVFSSNAQEISLLQKKYTTSVYNQDKKYAGISNDSNAFEKYNPINVFFDLSMHLYQAVISEQLAADCTFSPSCSEFSKVLIRRYGLFKGVFLTADRLMRCNGNASGEYPDYQLDHSSGKIIEITENYRWQNIY